MATMNLSQEVILKLQGLLFETIHLNITSTIVQGEVEQVSLMKPKAQGPNDEGFLEYMEDIIGTDKRMTHGADSKFQILILDKDQHNLCMCKIKTILVSFVKHSIMGSSSLDCKNSVLKLILGDLNSYRHSYYDAMYTAGCEVIVAARLMIKVIDILLLESLNEKRSGVVQMVKLAEKERDGLEDVKNEAEAYMLKELSFLKWQEKATRLAYEDNSAKMVDMQTNVSSLEENLKAERAKIQESHKSLKELEAVHKNFMKRQEELNNDLRNCKEEFKEFERQDVKYREDLKHKKQKIKKLEDKLEKDSAKIEDLTKECENSTDLIPKLEENIPNLQKLFLDEERILDDIVEKSKVETEGYRSKLVMVRAELEPWERQVIDHKGKLDVACTESKLLTDKHEASRSAFEDAQKQMGNILERIEKKASNIAKLQTDIEKHQHKASEAHKVEEVRNFLVTYVFHYDIVILDLVYYCGLKLEILVPAETPVSSFFIDFNSSSKYDVAVSTACSGLDYIVVETTATAQACVELLRRENLGVATFMILEKQVDLLPKLKDKVSTPEGVPRLFDLVRVQDARMKLAFYAALGNTVVANDLDQATRIAYGGNMEFRRVVTLDGALFEKSGTMSGGGSKPRGGKMGSSIRAVSVSGEAVASAEKELSIMVDKLNGIRQLIVDAVRSYQASEKAITHLEMELAKCQKEVAFLIDSLHSEHGYLEKQLGSLKAASQPNKDELDRLGQLKEMISSEEKEIDRLTKGSKDLKEKAVELQNKIENAGGEVLKAQKTKVNKIQLDIDKTSTDINRHMVQIETNQKMIKKLTKGIEDSKKEKDRLVEEKEKLRNVFKEIEERAFAVQENHEKTQKLIDEHTEVLDKAKTEYENVKKVVDELRASEVDADYKLSDMKKGYKELDMKGKGYKKKLDDLQNALTHHMEQIQKDLVDPEKLQMTLADETLAEACDLRRALEMVTLIEAQLKEMNPNLDSIAEYRKKVSLYNERVEELNMVTQQRDDIKRQHDEWRKKRLDEFMAGFNTISLKLKEMYQMIMLGGDAELELVDSLDPFSEGVVFSVRPPKKSWKNIANNSCSFKQLFKKNQIVFLFYFILNYSKIESLNYFQTLSSLALVFALHHYKPTPLYVMDEIDAALDFKNVSIVGHYVKDRTKDAQFIIISLRNNMFELADRLVGIYKTDNCTKSITINPGSFVVCQKAA
ncbi:structural maintenance of chromosomes protein 4-like [Euphorbia lathyris]|uniref:structural maintenance of chromosomes protein 4-like n=1 Tax=Euphorbia lathyris TaxID=212925 RepID=UPI0033137D70